MTQRLALTVVETYDHAADGRERLARQMERNGWRPVEWIAEGPRGGRYSILQVAADRRLSITAIGGLRHVAPNRVTFTNPEAFQMTIDNPAPDEAFAAEAAAYSILRLVSDMPGHHGRHRAARIIGGFPVEQREGETDLAIYAGADVAWPLKDSIALIDAMIAGGLLAQTMGQRPTLVLTRSGHRAFETLEAESNEGE